MALAATSKLLRTDIMAITTSITARPSVEVNEQSQLQEYVDQLLNHTYAEKIRHLDNGGMSKVTDLEPLANLTRLQTHDCNVMRQVMDLVGPLANLTGLRTLNCNGMYNVTDLDLVNGQR